MPEVHTASVESPAVSAPLQAPEAAHKPAALGRLARVTTVAILALALGVLAFVGHRAEWKLPRFSELVGNGGEEKDDWCAAHAVPESVCVECNPAVMPKGKEYGWCKKHLVQECPLCHPEIAQLPKPPAITQADLDRTARGLQFAERAENNTKCKTHQRRIQFASPAVAEKAGIEVRAAIQAPMTEFIAANGEITFDQTQVARLSSRLPGTVWQVSKQVGDSVRRGEVIALVEAAEVGRAKAEFLQARAALDLRAKVCENLRSTPASVPTRTLQEAEAALAEARIRLQISEQALVNLGLPIRAEDLKALSEQQLVDRLQFLGLPENLAASLDRRTTSGNLLPLVSPLDGIVVEREAVAGENVTPATVVFVLANTRQMWLTLDVRLEDAGKASLGQTVTFRPDGASQMVTGKVTWISTAVDEKTRTVKVRALLPNTGGNLRSHTFGTGRIILREEKDAVVVANDAVHWEGCCHVVFVRDKHYLDQDSPKVFHVRKVVPGARTEDQTEIVAGLLPGEVVATKGSGVLRSELLKNNLGDG